MCGREKVNLFSLGQASLKTKQAPRRGRGWGALAPTLFRNMLYL